MIKTLDNNKQEQLKQKIIEWSKNNNDALIRWDHNKNRHQFIKNPFNLNGSEFNWNFDYNFSCLTLMDEISHFIGDALRNTSSDIIFMAASKIHIKQ